MSKKNVAWARSAVVGPHFLACIGIGWYFGSKLDDHFGTDRIWMTVLILLGIAAGFINLFRELAVINREEAEAMKAAEEDNDDINPTRGT